jgi:hypothetical protein
MSVYLLVAMVTAEEVKESGPAVPAVAAVPTPGLLGKKQIDAGKEAAIEAEVRAARERAVVPLEVRVKQFREMLQEKDVSVVLCLFVMFSSI